MFNIRQFREFSQKILTALCSIGDTMSRPCRHQMLSFKHLAHNLHSHSVSCCKYFSLEKEAQEIYRLKPSNSGRDSSKMEITRVALFRFFKSSVRQLVHLYGISALYSVLKPLPTVCHLHICAEILPQITCLYRVGKLLTTMAVAKCFEA